MIVEIADKEHSFDSAKSAGQFLRGWISDNGFEEWCAVFSEDCELEWTDPDLFMEWPDIDYMLDMEIPEAFVRQVFVNWQVYSRMLRGGIIEDLDQGKLPSFGNEDFESSDSRKNGDRA